MSELLNDHRLWIAAGVLLVTVLMMVFGRRSNRRRPAPIQIGDRVQ